MGSKRGTDVLWHGVWERHSKKTTLEQHLKEMHGSELIRARRTGSSSHGQQHLERQERIKSKILRKKSEIGAGRERNSATE